MKHIGYCTYNKGYLYFDEVSWEAIKNLAHETHKSPAYLVLQALKRYVRKYESF